MRRPSIWQRYWIRNLLVTSGGLWLLRYLYLRTVDNSLATTLHVARETIALWYREHIFDPVSALVTELFDTLHKREEIVSKRDLDQSKEALHRMLSDFSKSNKGIELIQQVKDTFYRISEQASTVVGGSLKEPSIEPVPTFSPEEALDALMKSYEAELPNPIQGVLFGNLATSILIQMQKLKVHTEAAMLMMDQVLASNQLTMAGTAAMPAFLFFGGLYLFIRRIFQPRRYSLVEANLRLRLALTEVERSLLELYCGKHGKNHESNQDQEYLKLFKESSIKLAISTSEGKDLAAMRHYSEDFSNTHMVNGSLEALTEGADMQYYHGMLHYSLIRLRLELYKFFSMPIAERTDNDATTIALYDKLTRSKRKFSRDVADKTEYGLFSYLMLPWQLFAAVIETLVWNREGADPTVSEYHGVLKDIRDLESPDDEVSGSRKIITVMRMRNSYRCFIPKL